MKLKITELRQIIQNVLLEGEDERVVFDASDLGLPVPKHLLKLLDPDISPRRFAELDAKLDTEGKPEHQAFALAAFAMTYADNDAEEAAKLIKRTLPLLKKIKMAMDKKEKIE